MTNRILKRRYQIISELGKGGFGKTYLAIDIDLPNNPQCVVKQLAPDDPRPQVFQVAKDLFDKEAKILHRLGKHEQIPQLFAYFEEGGQFYLVQEFIDGYDLIKEIYSRSRFTENQTVQLLTEILSVLRYVHQQNVIHRDLKPQNIRRRKSDGKIVLIDFGAVKEITGLTVIKGGQASITRAVGTPGYMPAEQWSGQPRFCSDIYAVGIIAIKALTGVRINQFPKDSSTGEIIWKDRVNVSDDLGRVLDKMVLYDWRYRYHSIDEVIAELRGGNYSANATIYPTTMPPRKPVNNPSTTVVASTVVPNIGNLPQTQPPPSSDDYLLSASGVDYTELRNLLALENWKEANDETNKVMKKAAQVGWFGELNSKNIKEIPLEDLQIIDQLWVKYSNGHFGFSVQKQVYLDTRNPPLKYRKETYKRFGERVGWKLKRDWGFLGGWLVGTAIIFGLLGRGIIFDRKSPRGHLPVIYTQEEVNPIVPVLFWLLWPFFYINFFNFFIKGVCFVVGFYLLLIGVDARRLSLVWSHHLICTLSKKLDEHHNI